MAEVDTDTLLLVGRVWRAHGVRGEMKVVPETDDPERFSDLETVFLGTRPETATPHAVESARFQTTKHGLNVVLKLVDIDTRDDADALRKVGVYARADDLPPLEEGELFVHDLIGLRVVTEDGTDVGVVRDVLDAPAQLVYVVERPDEPDAMIPDVPEFVVDLDIEAQRIVVRPIEGMLE